ncbi:DUF3833 family protein [Parvularcula sp. LCG005]|uniref:DUF3833 family protein n=1 Tax=Parvularcula sp. LCG005 TaxID=3078805 RepID=UPI0029422EAD|nr:DUF3833 family protein [Parvularcula sp. LCG005]WOI52269.1 DUF3833 family protein [Parvularcula sp. LCG005]
MATLVFLPGCVSGAPVGPVDPALRPENMFAGHHVGQGVLTFRDGEIDRRFTVYSTGAGTPDGRFEIVQDIHYADGEHEKRRWSFTPSSERTITAKLSNAGGAVQLTVHQDRLSLTYPVKDLPFGRVHQTLYIADTGTIINEGHVTVLGYTVRRLHEQIVAVHTD